MAEMADAAAGALRYQAANEPMMAKREEARVQAIAAKAAASAPAPAQHIFIDKAQSYGKDLSASGKGSQAERKKLAAETSNDNSVPVEF